MKYHVAFDIDFKRNEDPGFYIALEGIDGSGKTTQIDLLYRYFVSQGKEIVKTREPRKDEGLIGKLIQQILHGKTSVPSTAFQYLFSADREMHHTELILPSLKAGKIVISDRCFWSAIPYGILDKTGKVDDNTGNQMLAAQSILSFYHRFTVPDITFYLDVPLAIAMQRVRKAHGEKQKEIYEDEKKLAKTIEGYEWLLQKFPKEFIVIDATKSVEEVTTEILSVISQYK